MRDGSDAIADWPILNALLNTAAGATWVSVHHGGGVGIGNSIHARHDRRGRDRGCRRASRAGADRGSRHGRHASRGRRVRRGARSGARGWPRPSGRDVVSRSSVGRDPWLTRRESPSGACSSATWPSSPRPWVRARLSAAVRWPMSRSSRTPFCVAARRSKASGGCATCLRSTVTWKGRRTRALGHPGPRRLSHAPGVRRRPGTRVRSPRCGSDVRGAPRRRGGILDDQGDPCRRSRGAHGDRGPASRRDARARNDDVRGQERLRARSQYGAGAARGRSLGGRDPDLARRPRRASGHAAADVDWAIEEVLPHAAKLAVAADVFVERGTFDVEQARRYLLAAPRLALGLHGDQLSEIGAVPLAVELGARSVDHLEATRPRRRRGARGERRRRGPAAGRRALPRTAHAACARLVDAGAVIALATDFNPGSAFCESLPVVCTLACTARPVPRGSAHCLHGQRRARGRPSGPRKARARAARRSGAARSGGLAPPRLPPRRRHRPHRDPGGPGRGVAGIIRVDGDAEAAATAREGEASRVRPRRDRRRGQRDAADRVRAEGGDAGEEQAQKKDGRGNGGGKPKPRGAPQPRHGGGS